MNQTDDRAFIRRFSGIILGLVAVTVIIIVLALSLRDEPDPGANPSQQRFTEERIAPVAAVRTGKEGQAAPAQAEAAAAAEPTTVSEAAVDGEQVYQTVCMACHAAGVAGAPIPGSEALAQRHADKGAEGLVASVINGLNVMPPRAGRPDLTDEQIRAAVDFMLQ
jgi:cytochrome c5